MSANVKARREALCISKEKLAEMTDVSIQMIRGIEGRRTWVSDKLLSRLAVALGVHSFQLLVPAQSPAARDDVQVLASMLNNLRQNLKDDIDTRFDRLLNQ